MQENPFSPSRLKEAMGEMSNVGLAEKLGCARSSISMYLSGSRTPNKMTVQLMAICLNVSPAWLMGLDVSKYVKKPTPVSESGLNPIIAQIMDVVCQLSPETQQKCLDYFESLLALQNAVRGSDSQD